MSTWRNDEVECGGRENFEVDEEGMHGKLLCGKKVNGLVD